MLARALGWAASSPNVTPAWPGSTPGYSTWRNDMIDPRRQVWQASAHVASGIARYRRAMRHTRCHTWCGTTRGTCRIAGEASRAHRCSTGKTTSALACPDTVATSAARASGRMAVRYGGKACEGGQGCESRRTGTGGTANTCETQEFRGLLVPVASAVAGALAVLSARLLEGDRCSLPTCECPGDDLLATRCRFGPARKSISRLSISARVRRFATPGKSR